MTGSDAGERIVLLTYSLRSGGAERVVTELANHWSRTGHVVTVLTLVGEEKPFYDLHPGVEVQALGVASVSEGALEAAVANMRRIWHLRRILRRIEPDVAIGAMPRANVLLRLATIATRTAVILTEHTDPLRYPLTPVWKRLRGVTYPFADSLVAVSQGILDRLPGCQAADERVIPNPVTIRDRDELEAAGQEGTGRRLVGMGRLAHEKGFDLLIRAFAQVADARPEWNLEIWGEGEGREALEALICDLELEDRILMPGRTNQPFRVMASADLFVLSSRYEGFGNVLAEAMCVGVPVVSFACPSGPEEIVRHGVDGLLVPPEDVEALASAIARLMDSPEARRRLAERAVEARDRFGSESIMKRWDELLEEVRRR